MTNPVLAPFISLDGIDGTGKSTQCRLLAEWLRSQGVPLVTCNDPGGTPLGSQLRQILLESRAQLSSRAEALLFMASRAELVHEVIRPALESGSIVLSDRFVTANVVYQGYAGGLDPTALRHVGMFSAEGLQPDVTIILDLPLDIAFARRGRAADRMESRGREYFERVRSGFLEEAKRVPERFAVIDATPSVDEVQRSLRELVQRFLSTRGIAVTP